MITTFHRFHGHASLTYVYARGHTVRGSQLSVRYVINQRRTSYRAAVVVSRKVHKSAVVRGRIRRRIYEIIRTHESLITQPYDVVVTIFSSQLAVVKAPELQDMLMTQLRRAGIVAPNGVDQPTNGIVNTKEPTA